MSLWRPVIDSSKTIALVSVVTLLVWLWAESESLRSARLTPKLDVKVELPLVDARLEGLEAGGVVRVTLRGSTSGIDQAQRAMTGIIQLVPGTGGVPSEPGEHVLSMRDVLAQLPFLRDAGVSVDQVEPQQVRLRITQMQEVRVPVTIEAPTVEFEIPPAPTPREVTLRLPAGIKLAERYSAMATLDEKALAEAREGERFRTTLKVALPGMTGESPEPQTVAVEFTLRRRLALHTEPSVPILICLPPDEADRWVVQVKDASVREVSVAGPSELVQQVKDRKVQLAALLVLSADDLKNRISSKAVTLSGPAGLILAAKDAQVSVTISPRTTK